MSMSEMRAELDRLRAEVGRLSEENERLAAEAAEAERRRAELERLLSRLAAELRSEKGIVRRYNLDRFVSTKDNAFRAAARAADSRRPYPGAKRGPKRGSRNFAGLDLEALSSGNEPLEGLVRVGERECYSIELHKARIEVRKVVYRSYRRPDGSVAEPPTAAGRAGPVGRPPVLQVRPRRPRLPLRRLVGALGAANIHADLLQLGEGRRRGREAGVRGDTLLAPADRRGRMPRRRDAAQDGQGGGNGYLFAFSADGGKGKVRALRFSKTRGADGVVDPVLEGFGGVVTVDGYDRLEASMPVQRCLAHARREWAELAKSGDKGAEPAVAAFDAVFADERAAREASDGSPGSLLSARLSGLMPGHVEALKAMMRSMGEGSPQGVAAEEGRRLLPQNGGRAATIHVRRAGGPGQQRGREVRQEGRAGEEELPIRPGRGRRRVGRNRPHPHRDGGRQPRRADGLPKVRAFKQVRRRGRPQFVSALVGQGPGRA